VFRFRFALFSLREQRFIRFGLFTRKPHSPSFDATSPEGSGKLGHIASRRSGRAARAAYVSDVSPHREVGRTVTPVLFDQCQQSTIHLSRWAPVVSAHSASCFPHVAIALGSCRLEPASVFVPACTWDLSSHAALTRVPSMLRHLRVPGGTLERAVSSPRDIASTDVARCPCAPKRGRAQGSPRWSRPASPTPHERGQIRRWSEASFTSIA
jgi:hypothetical protein